MSHPDTAAPRAARSPGRPGPYLAPAAALAALALAALAAILLGARLAYPLQRVPVAAGDERALVGFNEREQNALGEYRWTRPGSAVFLYGFDGRLAIVTLRLNGARPEGVPQATLAPQAAGRALGAFAVAGTWRRYHVLAPTRPAGDTQLLLGGDAFRPPGDERDLGVAFAGFDARPAADGAPLPPLERTLFLLSLPLLGWLGARGLPARPRLAVAAALALLAGWAAASPVESGYLLPTFGWPWWPLVPLALLYAAQIPRGPGLPRPRRWPGDAALSARFELAALAGITALALGLRLAGLGELPQGLWRDEARHGLIALEIWRDAGYRPVYVVQGADLPALLFYLMAPALGLLGPGVASVRLVSALAGALTPLALWWAARPLVGPRGALLGAALLAWASWSLSMSRWGFPATLDQALTLTAVGFALRALAELQRPPGAPAARRPPALIPYLAVAGALAGLAAYAYHTGRLAGVVLAGVVAVRLGWDRTAWRRAAPGLAAAALAGLVVLGPLLRFVAEDFAGYNRRTGAVAFYNDQDAGVHAPLLLLLRNGERYLLMWHVAGERNGRHHAPGAPMLDPLAGALMALGLALALLARRTPAGAALLVWLGLALVPGMLSTGAPHAMRSLPALAPACVLAGAALAWLAGAAGQGPSAAGPPPALVRRRLAVGLASLVLLGSLGYNTWLYAGQMPRDPRVQEAFDTPETMMGRAVRAGADSGDAGLRAVRVFLPAQVRRNEVVELLTDGAPVGWFDPATGLSEAPGAQALLLLPAGASAELRASALAALGEGARELAGAPRYPGGGPVVLAYGVGEGAERLLRAAFGG